MNRPSLPRRRLLERALAGGGLVALAGCFGQRDGSGAESPGENDNGTADDGNGTGDSERGDAGNESGDGNETDGGSRFPEVENPPDAVYLPTHREAMRVLEPVHAGDYGFTPMVTYPHRFWLVTGDSAERVEPTGDDRVHLMVTAWDRETGTVIPVDASVRFETTREGASVDVRNPWLMLSQEMGFHFGDNVPLEGEGTYRVRVEVGSLDVRTTGAFEGRFDEPVSFDFSFDFDDDLRRLPLEVEYLDESQWGDPGAIEPMGGSGGGGGAGTDGGGGDGQDGGDDGDGVGHRHTPYSALPPAEGLPGTLQGAPESADAVFATTLVEPDSRFAPDGAWYLAVSPRTRYNRCVLPLMTLGATLESDAEDVRYDDALTATLDDEIGYHYGTALESVAEGDELTVEPLAPPQVARHQGYETAFLDLEPTTLTLSP